MLRGERDQNLYPGIVVSATKIPECSGGSEIKTLLVHALREPERYQNAPGGARSKHDLLQSVVELLDTRMLRGERDQNAANLLPGCRGRIPECSGGSEIKTRAPEFCVRHRRYQNAPGGARSKRCDLVGADRAPDTRMLRGERDQNIVAVTSSIVTTIPECSGGSEIKTS